ncbi:MAG: hypothetical protein RSD54_02565, partial [Ruthenibacterium sp.]
MTESTHANRLHTGTLLGICALPIAAALVFLRFILVTGTADPTLPLYTKPLVMWIAMLFIFGIVFLLCALIERVLLRKIKFAPCGALTPCADNAKKDTRLFIASTLVSAVILLCFYADMLFKGDLVNSFGGFPQTFLWHSFPPFVVVVCFLAVCCVAFSLLKIGTTSSGKKSVQLLVFSVYGICCIAYLLYLFMPNLYADIPHQTAYFQSVYNVWYNTPYEKLTTGIYGHYALFYKPLMMLFGHQIPVIVGINAFFGLLAVVAMFYVLHRHISSNTLRILAAMAMTFPVVALRVLPYWQMQPHRILFPALLMAYCTWLGTTQRDKLRFKYQLGGYALCSLGILWSTETGIICAISFAAYLCIILWQSEKCFCKKAWLIYFEQVCGVVASLGAAMLVVNLYNLACGGSLVLRAFFFPLFDTFYFNAILYKPMVWGNQGWVHCLILFLFCLILSIRTTSICGNHHASNAAALLGMGSILALGQFTYYVNRAAFHNFDIILMQAVFCIAYLADRGLKALRNRKKHPVQNGILAAGSVGLSILLLALSLTGLQLPATLRLRLDVRDEVGTYSLQEIADFAELIAA